MQLIMKREYGKSPAGNDYNGNWVARTIDGEYVDHDKYQNDLVPRLEKQGFNLIKVGE